MKSGKALVLIPTLAVVLAGLANAGPAAAATTLCKASWDPLACPMAERYPAGSEFKAPLRFAGFSEAKLVVGTLTVKCTTSTVLFKTKEEAGAPLLGEVTEFSFGVGSCSGCTNVTAIHLSYSMELERTTPGQGSLTFKSGGSGNPAIKISGCPGGVTCVYKAEGLGAPIGPGELTEFLFEKAPLTKESGGCTATEAYFYALYGIASLRESPEQAWAMAPAVFIEKT